MDILVLGGTRYFGKQLVNELLKDGHKVSIATRGKAKDNFGNSVVRIILERTDFNSIKDALQGRKYDIVYDMTGYCSNDIRCLLEVICCDKYIYMSSTAVYDPKRWNTKEEDFDPLQRDLIWCARTDFSYEEAKRQAECALWQVYKNRKFIAVRYPVVLGKDDYTNRLLFYIENTIKEKPMNIDNIDEQMSYIRSDEAGKFLAFLADKEFTGAINGAANGTVSIREILNYVEEKSGKKARIYGVGEEAPYNRDPEFSINTDKAKEVGYEFTELKDWIYDLVEYYIDLVKS